MSIIDPPQRSSEERERARAERERRRAANASRPGERFTPTTDATGSGEGIAASSSLAAPATEATIQPVRIAASAGRPARLRHVGLAVAGVLGLAVLAAAGLLIARGRSTPKPVPPPAVVRITIPEGYTRLQIAHLAAADGLRGSYLAAARRSADLSPARYGAPHGTPNLEGFLFPATYELYAHQPASHLVALQLQAFEENFTAADARRARALHLTPYQLLIVASMVEREALRPGDRAKVAAVVYNRLRIGMALGIDSTIRYALNDFEKPLTEAQLHIDSPYNTRTHHGLPPTPISNPGLAAIDAAAHPARVPYLYYVNGADGCGELVFSTEAAQFERDAAAYDRAVAANGGHVPACHRH